MYVNFHVFLDLNFQQVSFWLWKARECWMIYRGLCFLSRSYDSAHRPSHPTSSPVSMLTKRDKLLKKEGGESSQILWRQESLVFYKSFNNLWVGRTISMYNICNVTHLLRRPQVGCTFPKYRKNVTCFETRKKFVMFNKFVNKVTKKTWGFLQ